MARGRPSSLRPALAAGACRARTRPPGTARPPRWHIFFESTFSGERSPVRLRFLDVHTDRTQCRRSCSRNLITRYTTALTPPHAHVPPRTHATVPWEHCFRCDTRVAPDGSRTRAGSLAHLASCQPSYGSFAVILILTVNCCRHVVGCVMFFFLFY